MAKALPTAAGFYWAKWRIATDGTREASELTPSDKWEPVEVYENCSDPNHEEYLRVSVLGVERSQDLDGFVWGDVIAREVS